jgi:hypothetical protein
VERTSSITRTLERLRIALAIQRSCFSLQFMGRQTWTARCEFIYPVEKFSPPSETKESRLRNTFALIVSAASSEVSSVDIRCTRRKASNLKMTIIGFFLKRIVNNKTTETWTLTISASSYSLKTSRVERKVPLKIVGSSGQCHEH